MLIPNLLNTIVLIYGGYIDYKKREIPHLVPITLMVTGLFSPEKIGFQLFQAGITLISFLVAARITKSGLPGGDFKLLCALTFSVGLVNMLCIFFLAYLFAIIENIARKETMKRHIPLCSYVAPAYILLFAAQYIIL